MTQHDDKSTQFLKNGYLHLKSWISLPECERLILRMRDLSERKCPDDPSKIFEAGESRQSKDDFFLASARNISFFFDKNAHDTSNEPQNPFFRLNKVGHALHKLCPVFHKFSHRPRFYDLMHELGQKKPHLIQSMFIFKQPRFGDEVPAHQDASFLFTTPNSVIGLWFALKDATIDNGCLWVLPQGHLGPLKNRFYQHPEHGLRFGFEQKVRWPIHKFQPIPAKAGDIIVLHGLLPHFSQKNHSPKPRFAFTLHFIDQKCHYERDNWLATN